MLPAGHGSCHSKVLHPGGLAGVSSGDPAVGGVGWERLPPPSGHRACCMLGERVCLQNHCLRWGAETQERGKREVQAAAQEKEVRRDEMTCPRLSTEGGTHSLCSFAMAHHQSLDKSGSQTSSAISRTKTRTCLTFFMGFNEKKPLRTGSSVRLATFWAIEGL
nr:uncharacterized protein LOC129531581 isoform X2 [Gorilla gorilla gorilla]